MFTKGINRVFITDLNILYFHKLHLGHILFATHMIGTFGGKKLADYIHDHNPNQFARSNWAFIRTMHRTYNYLFPTNTKRRHFMEVSLPQNFSTAFHFLFFICLIIQPFEEDESTAMQIGVLSINTLVLTYFIGRVRERF